LGDGGVSFIQFAALIFKLNEDEDFNCLEKMKSSELGMTQLKTVLHLLRIRDTEQRIEFERVASFQSHFNQADQVFNIDKFLDSLFRSTNKFS